MKRFSKTRIAAKGFTLAELLVAMSVTLILVLLTLTITGTAMDSWRAARTEIRAAGQAKIMLNAIGRDLESMVSRIGSNQSQWLVATTNPGNLGPQSAPSPNASRLVFFTSASDRYGGNAGSQERQGNDGTANQEADRGGDISAVSYELDFVDPVFGSTKQNFSTFVMYRNLMEPDETYTNRVIGSTNLLNDFEASSGPNDLTDLICENVYEFTATFVVNYRGADGQPRTIRMPVMSSASGQGVKRAFAITGAGLAPDFKTRTEFASGRIASVELSITVLSDEGISIMKRIPFQNADAKSRFLEEHSYRYSRSVIIPQG